LGGVDKIIPEEDITMKKILLVMALCLVSSKSYPTTSVAEALEERGVVTGGVRTGGCCSRAKIHLESAGATAALIGGQFVDKTGKAIQMATPFVALTLGILESSGVDVSQAQRALKIAGSASNLATLLVSSEGGVTSVTADGTATLLLTVAPVLLEKLGAESQYYNLCNLLSNFGPAFMPASYVPAGLPAGTSAESWSKSQKVLAWTAQLLSIYIQGGITAEGPDESGIVTLRSSKGLTVQLNTNLAALAGPGVSLPHGYGFLKDERIPDFLRMLTTGEFIVNLQNTPA
jgi:hypothetical protein